MSQAAGRPASLSEAGAADAGKCGAGVVGNMRSAGNRTRKGHGGRESAVGRAGLEDRNDATVGTDVDGKVGHVLPPRT